VVSSIERHPHPLVHTIIGWYLK